MSLGDFQNNFPKLVDKKYIHDIQINPFAPEPLKKRGAEKAKSKSQDCCVTFKPKISKFCFLRMPELRKLIFCIWIRRP